MSKNEKLKLMIAVLLSELEENGIYFECGTLVFNTTEKKHLGMHVVLNHTGGSDE